ncbi:MAG: polysaccharide deacetylase family protein [Dehalococcoidales bacterium]
MINALCIDLEPWYSAELVKRCSPEIKNDEDDQVTEAVAPILNLLDKYNVKATFAVLGIVAERHPQVVRDIFDRGHEIASHSYSHKMLQDLGQEAFEDEVKKSVELLSSITGEKPKGFRAPSVSLNNSTKWALPVLQKYNFKWDASICPAKTILYGEPGAPSYPYRPSLDDITKEDTNSGIIEFPLTTLKFGVSLPVAGGFYFRVSPLWFLKFAIKRVNKSRPANVYIHPWETYHNTPRVKHMPIFYRFVSYYGIDSMLSKLEKIIKEFEFKPVCEVLGIA